MGNTKLTSTVCGSKMAAMQPVRCCSAAKVTLGVASIPVCGKNHRLSTPFGFYNSYLKLDKTTAYNLKLGIFAEEFKGGG